MFYNLSLVNEGVSDKMFTSLNLKGLPSSNESFTTIVKFSKERGLEEIKRELSTLIWRMFKRKVIVHSTIKNEKLQLSKIGHMAKDCRLTNTKRTTKQPMKC